MTARCEHCGTEFEPPLKNPSRRSCSRACAIALGWRNGNRERRCAALSAAQKARGAAISEQNRQRWARPGERERLSERNRTAWADPAMRAKLSAGIRANHSLPEMRRLYSEIRRLAWQDPEYRAKASAAIRRSKNTAEARGLFSALLRERWKDPVWREKWAAATRRRYAKPEPESRKPALAIIAPVPPPPPKPQAPLSAARQGEIDAIAAFLARHGATKLPGVGDPALGELAPLQWDRTKRKFTRAGADGDTGK